MYIIKKNKGGHFVTLSKAGQLWIRKTARAYTIGFKSTHCWVLVNIFLFCDTGTPKTKPKSLLNLKPTKLSNSFS